MLATLRAESRALSHASHYSRQSSATPYARTSSSRSAHMSDYVEDTTMVLDLHTGRYVRDDGERCRPVRDDGEAIARHVLGSTGFASDRRKGHSRHGVSTWYGEIAATPATFANEEYPPARLARSLPDLGGGEQRPRRKPKGPPRHQLAAQRIAAQKARDAAIAVRLERTEQLKSSTKARLDLHLLRGYDEARQRRINPEDYAQRLADAEKDRLLYEKNKARKLQMMAIAAENDEKAAAQSASDMKLPRRRRVAKKRMAKASKAVLLSIALSKGGNPFG